MRESDEQLAAGKDKRITAVYPFVGERACALLCEASTAEELQESLMSLPFNRLVGTECHVIGAARSMADGLRRVEQQLGNLAPASARS